MRQYVNGAPDSSFEKVGALFNSTEDLRIGRYGYSATWNYHGTIDEVAIWNPALTGSEIALLYMIGGHP